MAAQLAVDDFMQEGPAFRVKVLSADYQNKADVGSAIVRQRDRTFITSSVATSDLTGPACAPTTVQWTMDTWAVANGTARPLLHSGGKSWTFIASDFALGKCPERDTIATLAADGGSSLGTSFVPLGTTDYSTQIVRAQASGAQVIALAMAGSDAINAIKQAAEFGIGREGDGQRLAGLLMFTTDVDALGLQAAQSYPLVRTGASGAV